MALSISAITGAPQSEAVGSEGCFAEPCVIIEGQVCVSRISMGGGAASVAAARLPTGSFGVGQRELMKDATLDAVK